MARPVFSAPTFPSQKSPSEAGAGKCGTSYHTQYEVRAPYKGANKYSTVLPVAYGKIEIGEGDIKSSLPAVSKESFHLALSEAIKGASEILHEYDKGGYIDDNNRAVILQLISRALKYQSQAKSIREWWEGSYQPDSGVDVYGWPLTRDNVQGCNGFAPDKGGVYTGNSVIEFTCPPAADKDLHDADGLAYQQLLYAAMLNARCAQEAAATVGIHNQNRESLEGSGGGIGGLASGPTKKKPGGEITSEVPPVSEHPEGPEADTVPDSAATGSKKKKDNTLLIVGAAGLGLLLMKGRK
jgi:hypothetical protein